MDVSAVDAGVAAVFPERDVGRSGKAGVEADAVGVEVVVVVVAASDPARSHGFGGDGILPIYMLNVRGVQA